jgi:hypothetical protein
VSISLNINNLHVFNMGSRLYLVSQRPAKRDFMKEKFSKKETGGDNGSETRKATSTIYQLAE